MKKEGYYSSGEFARMAHVSLRTIRYYDEKKLLKPSYLAPSGARFYTREDFGKLQQILLLKYLGFSLKDIHEMTTASTDSLLMKNALVQQKKLVLDRLEQMQLVAEAIDNTILEMEQNKEIDWSQMLDLIHLTGMETSLKKQYQDASNISARIRLHEQYSTNRQGWFPWLFQQCGITPGMHVLELGCGNGALWMGQKLPEDVQVVLSDISDGMIRDARRNIGVEDEQFAYVTFDCHQIPYEDASFDLVIANHVLFYCEDIDQVLQEIRRVLKKGGFLVCSTYSARHMQEITGLVKEFDDRIVLSGDVLYERFGLDNGEKLLSEYFDGIEKRIYEDSIEIDRPEPIIEYILSCHGNQNQILLDRYGEFQKFIEKRTEKNFHITKDAGVFFCKK